MINWNRIKNPRWLLQIQADTNHVYISIDIRWWRDWTQNASSSYNQYHSHYTPDMYKNWTCVTSFSICYRSRLKLAIRSTMNIPEFDIFGVTCEQLEWVTQMNLLFYLISVNVITRLKAEQNATNNKLNIIWPQL